MVATDRMMASQEVGCDDEATTRELGTVISLKWTELSAVLLLHYAQHGLKPCDCITHFLVEYMRSSYFSF